MKKLLSAIKSIYCVVTLGLFLLGACQQQSKTKPTTAETVAVPQVQPKILDSMEGSQNSVIAPNMQSTSARGEIVKPIGKSKSSNQKAERYPGPAPIHGTPNPGQLDSLRNAMDKMREQEVLSKRRKDDHR